MIKTTVYLYNLYLYSYMNMFAYLNVYDYAIYFELRKNYHLFFTKKEKNVILKKQNHFSILPYFTLHMKP